MAANDPETEKIITDGLKTMQLYCDDYNHLFKMGTSDVKINGELFFVGKQTLLGSAHPRCYSIKIEANSGFEKNKDLESKSPLDHSSSAESIKNNIGWLEIEAGKFLITICDPKNDISPSEIIDGPLMIATKIDGTYHFVGLAIVGAENKTSIFSIINNLSNISLKEKLLSAVNDSVHIKCFNNRKNFFQDSQFRPGINSDERECAAEKINQWKALPEKERLKSQKKIEAIEKALQDNSPEELQMALKRKRTFFFTSSSKQPTHSSEPNEHGCLVHRSL